MERDEQKPSLEELERNDALRTAWGGTELLRALELALRVPMLDENAGPPSSTMLVYAQGWNAALDAVRQAMAMRITLPGVDVFEPDPATIARGSSVGTVVRVTGWDDLEPLVYELEHGGWWASMDGVRSKAERVAEAWSSSPTIKVTVLYDPDRESRWTRP